MFTVALLTITVVINLQRNCHSVRCPLFSRHVHHHVAIYPTRGFFALLAGRGLQLKVRLLLSREAGQVSTTHVWVFAVGLLSQTMIKTLKRSCKTKASGPLFSCPCLLKRRRLGDHFFPFLKRFCNFGESEN